MAYPDWTGFQVLAGKAFSPVPPHGFFHAPVASSPAPHHPYMWGAQQFMPPYGTPPPPYLAMYPHGGLYGHPSIPPVLNYKTKPEICSGDSASEGSSEGSDANSQNGGPQQIHSNVALAMVTVETVAPTAIALKNFAKDTQEKNSGGQDSPEGAASKNGNSMRGSQNGANQTMPNMSIATPGGPGSAAGPTTNLNIGMDYWGGPTASPIPLLRGKVPGPPAVGPILPTGLAGPCEPSEHWLQAECEELSQRVEVLKEENAALKSEASRIRNEYEQLVVENTSLKGSLVEPCHEDDDIEITGIDAGNHMYLLILQSIYALYESPSFAAQTFDLIELVNPAELLVEFYLYDWKNSFNSIYAMASHCGYVHTDVYADESYIVKIRSTKPGLLVGIVDPVGKCFRSSKRSSEGMECANTKSRTPSLVIVAAVDIIPSWGIKKVTSAVKFSCTIFTSVTKVKYRAVRISSAAVWRSSYLRHSSMANADETRAVSRIAVRWVSMNDCCLTISMTTPLQSSHDG
ncbi:hypothetical protein ACLOJK_033723 [Asimina triloba]